MVRQASQAIVANRTAAKVVVLGVLVAAMATPIAVAAIFGWTSVIGSWMYGAIVASATVFVGRRMAVAASLACGLLMGVGTLTHPYPLVGAIFLGLVMGVAAAQARRGLHSAVLMVPIVTAFAVAQPPSVVDSDLGTAAIVAVVGAAGGLWTVLVSKLLFAHKAPTFTPAPVEPRVAHVFAVVAGATVGVATWAMLTWFPTHQGGWLVMTLMVVMQPDPHATAVKSISRAGGTLLGVLVALGISTLLPEGSTVLFLALANVFLFAALVWRFALSRPYWQYVAIMTPAVVLMDGTNGTVGQVAEDRLVFTVIGALVAIAIAVAIRAGVTHATSRPT